MMRGMYSAISGLRNHQIMLDVTANDLANVNTVGFKASRTSFRDSLAQLQRSGASATTGSAGAKSAQIGLGVQLGSIDNLMTNGAFHVDGQPVRRRHHRHRLVPRVEHRPDAPAPAAAPDTFPAGSKYEYTRAGNFTLNDQGELATQDGWRVVGKGVDATTGGPRRPTSSSRSRRSHRRVDQHRRRRDLHARRRRRPRHGRLPVAGRVPERVRPGSQLGQPLEGDRQLRRRGRRHARRQRPRPDRGRPARDEQRRPGDRVHQHDHRAARLRGQLACALDQPTRCCRRSSTSSTKDRRS